MRRIIQNLLVLLPAILVVGFLGFFSQSVSSAPGIPGSTGPCSADMALCTYEYFTDDLTSRFGILGTNGDRVEFFAKAGVVENQQRFGVGSAVNVSFYVSPCTPGNADIVVQVNDSTTSGSASISNSAGVVEDNFDIQCDEVSTGESLTITLSLSNMDELTTNSAGPYQVDVYGGRGTAGGQVAVGTIPAFFADPGNTSNNGSGTVTITDPLLSQDIDYTACIPELGQPDDPEDRYCNTGTKASGILISASALDVVVDPDSTTGDVPEADPSCESTVQAVGWVLCPALTTALNVLDGLIVNGLVENTLLIETTPEQEESLRAIWNGFRVLANIGFVIAFFVIIYSAATGNIVSAYDVKKLLPRLFIAVVLVQLSFFLSMELVELFNVLGQTIGDILLAPLDAASSTIFPTNPLGNGDELGALQVGLSLLAVVIALILAWGAIGGLVLMSVVFLVRSMAIIVLVVVSPIAFVAWVLPGTQSIFSIWWKYFLQFLAIFPIAAAFFAAGKLVGSIWISGGIGVQFWGANVIAYLIGMVAMFAPYYMAPFMFKFAGNAIQGVVGGVNTMKEKFGESQAFQRNKAKLQSGNAVEGKGRFTKNLSPKALNALNFTGRTLTNKKSVLNTKRGRAYNKAVADAAHAGFDEQEMQIEASGLLAGANKARTGAAKAAYDSTKGLPEEKRQEAAGSAGRKAELEFYTDVLGDESANPGARRAAAQTLSTVFASEQKAVESLRTFVSEGNASPNRARQALTNTVVQDNIKSFLSDMPQIVKGAGGAAGGTTEKVINMTKSSVEDIAIHGTTSNVVEIARKYTEAAGTDDLRGQIDEGIAGVLSSNLEKRRDILTSKPAGTLTPQETQDLTSIQDAIAAMGTQYVVTDRKALKPDDDSRVGNEKNEVRLN